MMLDLYISRPLRHDYFLTFDVGWESIIFSPCLFCIIPANQMLFICNLWLRKTSQWRHPPTRFAQWRGCKRWSWSSWRDRRTRTGISLEFHKPPLKKSQSRYQNVCKIENRILNFSPHACQSGTPRTSSTEVPILNFLSVSGQAMSWLLTKQATVMSRKAGKRNFMLVHFVFDLPWGWRLTVMLRFCNLWIMIRRGMIVVSSVCLQPFSGKSGTTDRDFSSWV